MGNRLIYLALPLAICLVLAVASSARAQPDDVDYDTEHNLRIEYYHTREGIFLQEFLVNVQNLDNEPRNLPLKLLFTNTSGPVSRVSVWLWKSVPIDITVYDMVFMDVSYTLENVVSIENTEAPYSFTVGCNHGPYYSVAIFENKASAKIGYENLIQVDNTTYKLEYLIEQINQSTVKKEITEWTDMTNIFVSKTVSAENYFMGVFNFPAWGSVPVLDSRSDVETENGMIRLKLRFEIAGEWGSSGYLTVIDPEYPEGVDITTYTLTPPETPPPLPPPLPPPYTPPPYTPPTPTTPPVIIYEPLPEDLEAFENLTAPRQKPSPVAEVKALIDTYLPTASPLENDLLAGIMTTYEKTGVLRLDQGFLAWLWRSQNGEA